MIFLLPCLFLRILTDVKLMSRTKRCAPTRKTARVNAAARQQNSRRIHPAFTRISHTGDTVQIYMNQSTSTLTAPPIKYMRHMIA
jgi:hypothetical protein